MKILPILSFLVLLFILPEAMAAAWTQAKGSRQLILTSSNYNSSHFYNSNQDSQRSDIDFTKQEVNALLEIAITDDITVGTNASMQNWNFDKSIASQSVYDFRQCGVFSHANTTRINTFMAEAEIFVRHKLWDEDGLVVSVQPMVKTPCLFIIDSDMFVVENTMDYEMRLLAGYGFKWHKERLIGLKNPFSDQHHFVNLEAAYRKRNKQFADQIRMDGTAGFRFSSKTMLLGQLFTTFSNGQEPIRGELDVNGRLFVAEDSFHSVKAQLSLVHQLNERRSIQLGFFKDISGKNAGNGSGIMVAVWYSF